MEDAERRVIGFELKGINNMIRRKIDVRFSEAGLSELAGTQGPMLGFISDRSRTQDVFQRDIEKEFNIRRSTATVMLQNLEQKGYIVRETLQRDARLKRILPTGKAIRQHQEIQKQIDAFHEELEAGLTLEEKDTLFRILDKIRKNLL